MVEHLFRQEAGKMVATLTRIFGLEHLDLAQDVVQEALARALQTWPYYGIPQNPSAWILRVSRNLALDVVRRQKVFREKQPELTNLIESGSETEPDAGTIDPEFRDDRLRLMFVCCHPVVPPEAQVALALKTLCGFSIGEISRAFLTTEAAIAKRLVRAGQKIREAGLRFEIPEPEEAAERLDGVLQTLYFLFNEGYKASAGERLVRGDLCAEAIRLASLLVEHPAGNHPRAHALLALMLLNGARLPGRTDGAGNLLLLKEQDRSLWNRELIARGLFHLLQSAAGEQVTDYHLEAGIASCHCVAADPETTNWSQILSLYDQLVLRNDSPVVALNRAVALANVSGPAAGLEAVAAIPHRDKLDYYYLLYAVLGEFESQLNHIDLAADHFRKALELAPLKSEQAFLSKRLAECDPTRQPEAMLDR